MNLKQVECTLGLCLVYFVYFFINNYLTMMCEEDRILLLILVRKHISYAWMCLLASFYANYREVYFCLLVLYLVSACLYFRMLLIALHLDNMIQYDRYETRNIIIKCPQAYGVTQVTPDFIEELLRQDNYDLEEPVIDVEAVEALGWVPERQDPLIEDRYKGWLSPVSIVRVPCKEEQFWYDLMQVIKALQEMRCCLALIRTLKIVFFKNGPKNE